MLLRYDVIQLVWKDSQRLGELQICNSPRPAPTQGLASWAGLRPRSLRLKTDAGLGLQQIDELSHTQVAIECRLF